MNKRIVYSRETKDYALYLDGELVGYADTPAEGERTLDELAYSILSHQPARCDHCEAQATCEYGAALVCSTHYAALIVVEQEEAQRLDLVRRAA